MQPRAPPGGPAGPAQRAPRRTWGTGRGAALALPGSPAGPVQRAPRRTRTRGAGPASRLTCWARARHVGHGSWARARRIGHGELGRCSARASRLACWARAPRRTRGAGPVQPRASKRACWARAARTTSDTGNWAGAACALLGSPAGPVQPAPRRTEALPQRAQSNSPLLSGRSVWRAGVTLGLWLPPRGVQPS